MRPLPLLFAPFVLAAAAPMASAQVKRFAEAHLLIPGGQATVYGIEGADLNGDGDLDLLSVAYGRGKRLSLGDGTGAFVDATAKLGPQNDVGGRDLALADVDLDGDTDALFMNGYDKNELLLNSASGTFTKASYLLPGTTGTTDFAQCVAMGDVDGDGAPDAIVGNDEGHPNELWLNAGTGSFHKVPAPIFPMTWGEPNDALLTDVDGDGDLDALFAGYTDYLLLNQGAGTFIQAEGALPNPTAVETVAAEGGDLDADGDVDLVALAYKRTLLYKNDGAGEFADASSQLPPSTVNLSDVALRDFDGDGDLDALLLHSFQPAEPDLFLRNDGSGVFADASQLLPHVPHQGGVLYAGDLDGDLDVDAVLGLRDQNRIYLNDGTGALHDVTTDWPLDGEVTRDVALGDVDADGDLDALLANPAGSALYANGGRGNFSDVSASLGFALPGADVGLLGDVDGDGAEDALLFRDVDSLHLADGAGGLLPASPGFPADGANSADAALLDSDADGDLDLLLVNYSAKARHYRNDGAGLFTYAASDTPATQNMTCVAPGDVDGDGDQDALLGTSLSGTAPTEDRLFLNDGAGVFSLAAGVLPFHLGPTPETALSDVDGDGDLDALAAAMSATRLYRNDGPLVFTDASAQLPPGKNLGAFEILPADFDEDGDEDALGALGYWLNGGNGWFADAAGAMPWGPYALGNSNALAAGDVDGDVDLDVLSGKGSVGSYSVLETNRLYTNLTRQVTRTTAPRLGKPYSLALHGAPFSAFFFAWGSTPAEIALAPFGVLRLHPGALLVLDSSGLIGPGGPVVKTFHAPSDPFWVGVTVYWQALLGTPLRFTNLEATTFTAL